MLYDAPVENVKNAGAYALILNYYDHIVMSANVRGLRRIRRMTGKGVEGKSIN